MYLWAVYDLWPNRSSILELQDWKSCHHVKAEYKAQKKEEKMENWELNSQTEKK